MMTFSTNLVDLHLKPPVHTVVALKVHASEVL